MISITDGKKEEQITAEQFAKIMGIPDDIFKKLERSPVFQINPTKTRPDKLNGGVTAPAGKASKPVIKMKINGLMQTIRYYTTATPDPINERITKYEPNRLFFMDTLSIYPELDEALFVYCLPACQDSPVADKVNWHYSFQNKEKAAIQITERGGKISKCLALINGELNDEDIMLIAKGMYAQNSGQQHKVIPNPSAKNKTIAEVKADLTTLALNDPDFFLVNTDNDINKFYGMILDSVDREVLKVRKNGQGIRTWYWEEGPLKNEAIVDIKGGTNDFDALRSAIESNPNKYYDAVIKTLQQVSGKASLAQHINKVKADEAKAQQSGTQQTQPVVTSGTEEEFMSKAFEEKEAVFVAPKTFEDSNKLLASVNGGKRAHQSHNGEYWSKYGKTGLLTAENYRQVASEVLAKAIV